MENKLEDLYPKNVPIGPGPIDEDRLNLILQRELQAWKVIESTVPENPFIGRRELYREYKFNDFNAVMEYMGRVAVGCNIFPHHPRWENTWTTLKVWLTTWDIQHTISFKDVMLARFMDTTFADYEPDVENKHNLGRLKKEKEEFVERVRKLIAEDNLELAFDKLNEFATLNREKDKIDDLALIMGNYSKIRRSERIGDVAREEIELTYNKIRRSVLDFMGTL